MKLPFPLCKVCEDSDELVSRFKGFFQDHLGYRRSLFSDGRQTDYALTKGAEYRPTLRCMTCEQKPSPKDQEQWTRRYEWSWLKKGSAEEINFNARQTADALVKELRARGADPVRLKIPKTPIRFKDFPRGLDTSVVALARASLKVTELYAYQAEALSHLKKPGCRAVVISAPTGAGKTLVYQLHFLDRLARSKNARMLALFPSQALVHDQAKAFGSLVTRETAFSLPPPLTIGTVKCESLKRLIEYSIFYGRNEQHEGAETSKVLKRLDSINCLWGTPDKVYVHLYKAEFKAFLRDLELIVIDEAHTATGIFGGNYAFLLRRLLSLAPKAKVLLMSATFKDAEAFAATLCGLPPKSIAHVIDPMAKFEREVLLVPVWVSHGKGGKAGHTVETNTAVLDTIEAIARANSNKLPSGIVFGKSKRSLDALHRYIKKRTKAGDLPADTDKMTQIYKRDLESAVKRDLLRAMSDGEIRLMLATNALELGIDIGSVDFVILDSLPDSELSMNQRIGRAGRRRAGLAIIFLQPSPYHEYWLRQLRARKTLNSEDVRTLPIALMNERVIRANYIRFEAEAQIHLGLSEPEILRQFRKWTSPGVERVLRQIRDGGQALPDHKYIMKLIKDPKTNNLHQMRVALSSDEISIVHKQKKQRLGQISRDVFFRDLHIDAVWHDQDGEPYRVIDYEWENGFPSCAIVSPETSDRMTRGLCRLVTSEVDDNPMEDILLTKDFCLRYGPIRVKETFPGYFEMRGQDNSWIEMPDKMKFARPQYESLGLRLESPSWLADDPAHAPALGIQNLLRSFAPPFVGAAEGDVKIEFNADDGSIVLIDNSTGGNGVTFHILKDLREIITLALDAVRTCGCPNGCYKCVIPKYGPVTDPAYSKKDVIQLIQALAKRIANVDISAHHALTGR